MAPKKYPAESIVVMQTQIGHDLILRANPSDTAVRKFVKEHTRRYIAGEPGGPDGEPALRIFNAKRYASEVEFLAGEAEELGEIDVSDLLPTT